MVRVSITDNLAATRGLIRYDYPDVFGETDYPYAQDTWTCWLGKLAISCTAWKQVLTVHGYLPHQAWRRVGGLHVPDVMANASFVIEESFDPARTLQVECEPTVECQPESRIVRACLLPHDRCDVFVRPHEGLVMGASRVGSDALVLSEIVLVNVEALPVNGSGKPAPW